MNTVLMVILGLVSIVIIVSVMLQESNGDASALGGASTMAAKKAKGYNALLSKITIAATIVFVILTIVLVVLE